VFILYLCVLCQVLVTSFFKDFFVFFENRLQYSEKQLWNPLKIAVLIDYYRKCAYMVACANCRCLGGASSPSRFVSKVAVLYRTSSCSLPLREKITGHKELPLLLLKV